MNGQMIKRVSFREKVDFQPTSFRFQEILSSGLAHKDLWKTASLWRVSIQVAGGLFLTSEVQNILKNPSCSSWSCETKKIEYRVGKFPIHSCSTSYKSCKIIFKKPEMMAVASMVREGDKKWQEEMYCSSSRDVKGLKNRHLTSAFLLFLQPSLSTSWFEWLIGYQQKQQTQQPQLLQQVEG